MNISFWSFSFSAWAVAGSAVFLLAVLWLSGRILAVNRSGWKLALVEFVRLAAALLLALTLFQPEIVRQTQRTERPLVAVMRDASGSMTTRDVATAGAEPSTRNAWLSTQCVARFWAPLETRYGVAVESFGEASTNEADADAGTDINQALEDALNKHDELRAVLLLSDGDWNTGKAPRLAATRLGLRDIPVFSVVVGSAEYLPDLELRSVSAPAYALMDEHVSLPFTVQSRLPREVRTTVTLNGPSGVEAQKEIVIPSMGQVQDSVVLVPRRAGEFEFGISLPLEKDETFRDNNEKRFRMALRRELLHVLVVDSVPRWETRFIRNALSRDPGVEAHTVLLHPGMEPGGGRNHLPAFPAREKLTAYDVVFLGDIGVGTGELTAEQAEWLKGLVEQQGSGLVFLPGIRGRQASLMSTPLGELMPVELDPSAPAGSAVRMESHLALTHRGKDHLLTMLTGAPGENEILWKVLPGFWWHAPVLRAKPGTDVLAVHGETRNQYGRLPLLVTGIRGSGKVLYLGTDSAWRWRRGVEDTYHYRFWGQVVRWMAHQRHLAHREGIRFFYNPESPRRGDRIFLHATVFDATGFPVRDGVTKATITGEDGVTERVELEAEPGGWGVFTGSFTARKGGRYHAAVSCEQAGREVTSEIFVASPKREIVGHPARTDVLKEIAAITGGRSGGPEELADMVRGIELLPAPKPVEERLRLWCHPLWLALVVSVLGIYWTGRKFVGMV